MKTRQGFVSNSSSSSFTCLVCRQKVESWGGIREAEMVQCEAGHTFCNDHAIGGTPKPPADWEDPDCGDWRYEVPMAQCPICQMQHMSDAEELLYLRKKAGYADQAATLAAVKSEYTDYIAFKQWLMRAK